ncbi:MAG: TolC family protein, partial [Acidobacteriota bacterium]|nr:TolC family protein [Acidobacteriota bacterium]
MTTVIDDGSRKRHISVGAGTALAVTLFVGCTLGPEPRRPETAVDGAESFVHSAERSESLAGEPDAGVAEGDSRPVTTEWWRRIGDPEIVDLVEQAIAHNTDLRAAAARVLEADALMRKAGSSRWPEVTAGASASRVKNSFVLPTVGRVSIYSTTYSDSLSVSYLVDFLGKLRRTRQSAWASLLATEAAQQALEQAIVAQVVKSRVTVARLEDSIAVSRQTRESWERTLSTVERRYRGGLVAAVDL